MDSCEDNVRPKALIQGGSYVYTPPPRQFEGPGSFGQSTLQRRIFAAEVPYSAYSFVVASNLPGMLPEDINYLELKGCLRIPVRQHLDEFVKQYFRYVHPFLPLINEAVFWEMYCGTSQRWGPKISLLVLQSMIFAATAHVSSETLERMGFSSNRVARRVMYQRAKILYDLKIESSRVHIAQSALLISYWSPSFVKAASRPNTTWLSIAIKNAKSVKAHLSGLESAVVKDEPQEQRRCSLKRLWGCCIVRDSTLSIALRRSCQITAADRNAEIKFVLKYADLEVELSRSQVYDAPTKKYLIMAFLHLAELCRRMAHVSKLLFPFENGSTEDTFPTPTTDDKQTIGTFKYFLSGWCDTAKLWLQSPDPVDKPKLVNTELSHSSVALFTNLMYIYYYSLRIALANRQLLAFAETNTPHEKAHDIHTPRADIQDAQARISWCMKTLADRQLIRFLPVSVIACSALPLALHIINGRLNGSLQDSRLVVLLQAMRTYEYLYDGVEWVAETIKLIMGQRQLAHLLESALSRTSLASASWECFLASNPSCYLRVAVAMDLSFSQGRLPEEKDFPARLRDVEEKPSPAWFFKKNSTLASFQTECPARDPLAAETATLETTLASPLDLALESDLAKSPDEGDSVDDLLKLDGTDVVMEQSLGFSDMYEPRQGKTLIAHEKRHPLSPFKMSTVDFHTFSNVIAGALRSSAHLGHGINPSTREPLWDVPIATAQDLEDAVSAAQEASAKWSSTPIDRALLSYCLLKAEKPPQFGDLEVEHALDFFKFYATLPEPQPEIIQDDADLRLTLTYGPIGIVGAICPWNYPLVLAVGKIVPALLTGNCVITKPSPYTPYSIIKFTEIIRHIFPTGVIQAMHGGDDLGPRICSHPAIQKISFTGSTATGKMIMASASSGLKNVTLELGGNSASIIFPDVDIDIVAPQVALGSFFNSGQLCVASKRVYVHKDIYDAFLSKMVEVVKSWKVGSPSTPGGVMLGPVQNEMQYNVVRSILKDSVDKGYRFALGGHLQADSSSFIIPPSIVDNPPDDSRVVKAEAFGPIVPVQSWSDEDELLSRVNNTPTGLGGAVWSSDIDRAHRIASRIHAGTIWINSFEKPLPQAYLAGHKESGVGGEWGRHGLLSFLQPPDISLLQKSRNI
ncbi:hypothetical protein CEP52_014521 [Fusarium oligoseptatum]|uniref:aldehyde dehydrogenase (NAD(+)) n=1 Tax=Fusarium oligoseptatum TaxID=2604345 RepID=A0A428SLL0_9HYPO|nr:hypothetical protein CEP52_014521 [Fusarium oligoseptatum]